MYVQLQSHFYSVCVCLYRTLFVILPQLSRILDEYLDDYNQINTAQMKLVLFLDAVRHVCRIARIVRQPLGNALLLGVGGSGRQSLTRLAAHMSVPIILREFRIFIIFFILSSKRPTHWFFLILFSTKTAREYYVFCTFWASVFSFCACN